MVARVYLLALLRQLLVKTIQLFIKVALLTEAGYKYCSTFPVSLFYLTRNIFLNILGYFLTHVQKVIFCIAKPFLSAVPLCVEKEKLKRMFPD